MAATNSNSNNQQGSAGGGFSFLNKIVGENGVKTDITIKLSQETYYYMFGAILAAGLLLILLTKLVPSFSK